MSAPPKKRNPAVRPSTNGGNKTKLAAGTIAQPSAQSQLFRRTEQRLIRLGISFERTSSGDLRLPCPVCGGKLIVDAEKPWHFCVSGRKCNAGKLSFDELVW